MNSNGHNSNHLPRKRRNWLWFGLLAVVLVVPVFTRKGPLPVRTTAVEKGPIRSLISTNGKIEPVENFEAHAPISTTVRRLLVKEGDHVRRGQLLLQLDDADVRSAAAHAHAKVSSAAAQQSDLTNGGTHEEVLALGAELVKARSARDQAQRNADALHRLQQDGAASAGEVKQAEDKLQQVQAELSALEQKQKNRYSPPEQAQVAAQGEDAEAAYAAAQDELIKSNVRAPFDGVVYSLPAKQGAFVQAGELLLQEADLSRVLVRAFVDEPDVGRLLPGQKTEITWDAVPGRIWSAAVSSVPATVKLRGARNVGETTCVVDNADFRLLPNTNVGVTIIVAEHANVLTLQRDAIRIDDSKSYVFEIVDGRLQRRDVQIALQNLTRVEIASGLTAASVVAMAAEDSKPLVEGARVKVVQ